MARSLRMTSQSTHPITHWCSNCDGHFQLNQVRHCVPVPESALGEAEVLHCPTCGSYQIEKLLEADAQHCTVVFRLPGSREALGYFLSELETKFPESEPEIVAVQSGNALHQKRDGE
jgi:hypothetical protein